MVTSIGVETHTDAAQRGAWSTTWRFPRSRWPVEEHLTAVDDDFEAFFEACAEARNATGPSLYFYEQTVQKVRRAANLEELRDDELFHSWAYATLTSWGMHRPGRGGAKLTEFDDFTAALANILENVAPLQDLSILDLDRAEADTVADDLKDTIAAPGITASGAPLLANTKAAHFVLPDLVPPMDRVHTGRFFFGPQTGTRMPGSVGARFKHMFGALHRLATRNAGYVREVTGSYMCLGHAKGVDNAIIGYVESDPDPFGQAERVRPA